MSRCAYVWLCLCLLGLVEAQLLDLFEGDVCKEVNGKRWTCKKKDDCPTLRETLKKGIRPTTCAFIKKDPLVCCEPKKIVGAKSKQMCAKYGESVYHEVIDPFTEKVQKVESCAVVEPLISGGQKAQPREYPHMALIGYGEKGRIQWRCGGSLISERYILSAAHCTDGGSIGLARWARLGEYNIKSTKDEEDGDAQPEDYEIIERTNHYDYKSEVYNDIALYKLKGTVQFNEYIRPICLNAEPQIKGKSIAIATGWGRLEQSGKTGDILQKVNVTFSTRAECNRFYPKGGKLITGLDHNAMMCAGNSNTTGDTCKGDSGGPLQIRLKEPYCMYSQIGITSFGGICGVGRPAVYTRVSNFVEWVEGIVWP